MLEAVIGLIAVIDDVQTFGPSEHYSHLVRVLDSAPHRLLITCAKSDELYVQRPGFDIRFTDYPKEFMKVIAVEHIPRMIVEAIWLVNSADDCALLLELQADPNDTADAFVHRSLRDLMDIKACKPTAIGRAASTYI